MLPAIQLALLLIGAPQTVVVYGADEQLLAEVASELGPNFRIVGAAAQPAPRKGHPGMSAFEQGKKAYAELLFEEAVPKLTEAKQLFEASVLEPEEWTAYLHTVLYLSLTFDAMGNAERSDSLLDELAALGADPAIAGEDFPPPFRRKVADRLQIKAAKTGALRIESTPPGAAVYVNGRKLANSPAVIQNLPGGEHTVTLRLNGYASQTKKILVQAGFGIGADATPDLWEARLTPTITPAAFQAYGAIGENRLPDQVLTAQLQQNQKNALQAASLYIAKNGKDAKVCIAALGTETGWRGPDDFPADVLAVPPLRQRLIIQLADFVRAKPAEKPAELPVVAEKSQGSRWWLWTGVGAVVVGGATAAAIALQPEEAKPSTGEAVIRW